MSRNVVTVFGKHFFYCCSFFLKMAKCKLTNFANDNDKNDNYNDNDKICKTDNDNKDRICKI